ncbi:ABC transporter permease [Neobacillus ginsengisoli]|uniref:ABC-2 type transport system permease protein n=1 Tax=Neobacillus ginsengisoli TaxID=904295 RepID=A0ABT9XVT2_9BACI|nr:ABC transporter permease [Neobacillus ginsengisoli]MDQ0199673.1 ABC-2 type transport system permease protein [Neobacillus ginsengisoli]
MLNLKNEWNKLLRKRSTIVLFCLSALFPLIVGPTVQMMQNRFGFTAFDGESFPLVILSLAVSFYLPLLLALGVSDMFAGEQEQKTLSYFLVRPISRFKLFTSKIACTGIYLLVLLLIVWISSLITGAIWLENFTFHGLLLGISAFLLSWFPLMAIGVLLVFLVQWFGSSSKALTFSILLYVVMVVLTYLFPTIAQWLPAYDSNWYQRWINSGFNIVIMGRSIYLLSFCALFFTLGYYRFTRKEY